MPVQVSARSYKENRDYIVMRFPNCHKVDLQQILNQIYKIPGVSQSKLMKLAGEVVFPKGHLLFRADKIERNIYFLKKGIVRAYTFDNDTEITFWFGTEGDVVLSMGSYVRNQKSYENIELLEDCCLYRINIADLETLFQEDIHIANWGRKLAEHELIRTEERLISRQFRTATERYKDLLDNNAGLLQRVALGHIASYLGITQVSLSRIRADKK